MDQLIEPRIRRLPNQFFASQICNALTAALQRCPTDPGLFPCAHSLHRNALTKGASMRRGLIALVVCYLLTVLASPVSAQVSVAVTIGQPPPPVVYHVPPQPGPEFVWVEGYWYPHGHKYRWHDGYWTRAPFGGAYWVQPYYLDGRYYAGYWDNGHTHVEHDHHWDHDHDRRDYDHPRHDKERP